LLASFWIIFELFVVKEDLFAGGENEIVAAVHTFQDLIDEFHGLFPHSGSSCGDAMITQSRGESAQPCPAFSSFKVFQEARPQRRRHIE